MSTASVSIYSDSSDRILDSDVVGDGNIHPSSLTSTQSPVMVPEAPPVSTNESLLERIAGGDVSAVDECLEQYGGLVWSLARRHCRSGEDAEDAAQEIFVELWKSADRFDGKKASEATFVAMIARRRLIDRHRRGQNAPEVVSIDASVTDIAESHDLDQVELSDEAAKAAGCMNKLSNNQRKVLSLSIHQCQPHAAISSILNMPLGTVKSYARRGLLQLRECMERPTTAEATS